MRDVRNRILFLRRLNHRPRDGESVVPQHRVRCSICYDISLPNAGSGIESAELEGIQNDFLVCRRTPVSHFNAIPDDPRHEGHLPNVVRLGNQRPREPDRFRVQLVREPLGASLLAEVVSLKPFVLHLKASKLLFVVRILPKEADQEGGGNEEPRRKEPLHAEERL